MSDTVLTINQSIEKVEVQGKSLTLKSSIHLQGQLNGSQLLQHNFELYPMQIGVDEAGRGPLLGCLSVAAAILPNAWSGLIESQSLNSTALSSLTDSKKLSEKKRDSLFPLVQHHAIGYVIATIEADVVDQINILQATMLGMQLSTEQLLIAIAGAINDTEKSNTFNSLRAQLLFDGNRCPALDYEVLANVGIDKLAIDCQAWVKGDARHTSIAAASILAKVSRDQRMYQLDLQHPNYAIAKHKGYPTAAHLQAIDEYGVLAEHRRSYAPIKKALNK